MDKYSLMSFGDPTPDLRLEVAIARRSDLLTIIYSLVGDLFKVVVPEALPDPARRDRLWEETCFEFFIAPKHSPQYWEFNLSPSGHWNVYHFDDYRKGMKVEASFEELPSDVHRQLDSLAVEVQADLGKIVKAGVPIQAAISAVIKRQDGTVTYWALSHCGEQPDFHLRDSFTIEL